MAQDMHKNPFGYTIMERNLTISGNSIASAVMAVRRKTMGKRFLFVLCLLSVWPVLASAQQLYVTEFHEPGPLPEGWTVLSGNWEIVSQEDLVGSGKEAVIIASPVFSGCSICSVWGTLEASRGRASMLGWYQDENNYVELMMQPHNSRVNRWTLRQFVNGKVVARQSARQPLLDSFTDVEALISFDGLTFIVMIDQQSRLIEMEKAPGSAPFGTAGFQVRKTQATFGALVISADILLF
jgi:hypothetical protein